MGICQDLAALAACMLRVQGVPTKLMVGYAGKMYHAWNSVVIDGEEVLYDPTLELSAIESGRPTPRSGIIERGGRGKPSGKARNFECSIRIRKERMHIMASGDHGLTPIELSSFCSEIALMLGRACRFTRAWRRLKRRMKTTRTRRCYRGVSETLTQTGSLRDALESAHAFPTYLVEMCGVGERTGHLEDVMRGLSVYYERESRIRQAVRSAVTYPLVLAVMMVLILLVLILKVMPVFRTVLGSMGVAMTETGSVMMSVGTALGWVVLALVLVFVLAALACVLLLKSKRRDRALAALKKAFPPLRAAEHAAGFLPRGLPCWR